MSRRARAIRCDGGRWTSLLPFFVPGDPLGNQVRDADREEVGRGIGITCLDGAPLALDLRRYLVGAGPQAVDIPPQLLVLLRRKERQLHYFRLCQLVQDVLAQLVE